MSNFIQIGGFNIPWFLVIFLSGYLIGTFALKKIRGKKDGPALWAEKHIPNSLLIGLVVWKMSPLALNFNTVKNNIQAILFLPGGVPGILLGFAGGILYLAVILFRRRTDIIRLLKISGFYLLLMAAASGAAWGVLAVSDQLNYGSPVETSGDNQAGESPEIRKGSLALQFTLEALSGEEYALEDLKGTWVILNFWATWCPPCRAELPELKAFYSSADTDRIKLLGINLIRSEKNPEDLPDFLEMEDIDFPILPDRTGEISALFGIESIPTTIAIDPEGIIRAVKIGAVTRQWLEQFLN